MNLSARIQLHERFSTARNSWQRWVFDRLDPKPEDDLLEVGCGTGALWVHNESRIPEGLRLSLSDRSAGMAARARERLEQLGRGVDILVCDAQWVPFPSESFDLVVANHMLYHVKDLDRALAELFRVLRPGGRLVAAANGAKHMARLRALVWEFDSALPYGDGLPTSSFTIEKGEAILGAVFDTLRLHTFEDGLAVTEARPLVDYVRSMINDGAAFDDGHANRFENFLQGMIDRDGQIAIAKHTGLFEGHKA